MRTLTIVIPCFNEEGTIRTILERVGAVSFPGWKIETIVVNDGSTDGTASILKEYSQKIIVINESVNRGKGSAVRIGLQKATGDFIVIQDADLEYSPEEIPSLLKAVTNENSVVYGSRNLTRVARRGFILSRLGVWFMTELTNLLYGMKLTDIWTCFKLFPQKAKNLFGDGKFDSEIVFTLALARTGFQVQEVPISHQPRDVAEGKKIRYRDGFYAIFLIVADFAKNIRKLLLRRPFFWYLISVIFIAVLAVTILNPFPDPLGDAPSYLRAIEVIQTGVHGPDFIPNRILGTFLALHSVIALSALFGGIIPAWLALNIFFCIISAVFLYKIIRRLYGSETVAFVGGIFLTTNYAMLTFGMGYFMDAGGWAFYILAAYFILKYLEDPKNKYLYYSALSAGAGGLFKEYAFLACIAIAVILIGKYRNSIKTLLKKASSSALVALFPIVVVHSYVYIKYGYTYLNWIGFAQSYYEYSSVMIEYVKSFGSLLNLLGLIFLGGIYTLVRYRKQIIKSEHRLYILALFTSILPFLLWPAITQRILFITVPFVIIVACAFIKKNEKYWYAFVPVLALYAFFSFKMGDILNMVNLPF